MSEAVIAAHIKNVASVACERNTGVTATSEKNVSVIPSMISSARSFFLAMKNPFFQQAITFPYRIIYSKDGRRHFLKSHNKALFLNWKQNVYGKTGYTLQAQSCFVGIVKKGNDVFIVDVFGCRTRKRWEDIKWLVEHYAGVNL